MLFQYFARVVLLLLLIPGSINASCQNIDGKNIVERDKKSFLVSFILLNYSQILNDLHNNKGVYAQSLVSELKNQSINDIKNKAEQTSNAYDFAKKLTE